MKRNIFLTGLVFLVSAVTLQAFIPQSVATLDPVPVSVASEPVVLPPKPIDINQMHCLATNIYHEARGESMWGQVAVGLVVMNRVESKRYPNNVCDVIHEGPIRESWKTRLTEDPDDAVFYPVKNKCQFSWYCDGKADTIYKDLAWRKAQEIAYRIVVLNQFEGLAEGATHYHATYVTPYWQSKLYLVGRVDTHLFYRTEK